jgi:hypothetical protein
MAVTGYRFLVTGLKKRVALDPGSQSFFWENIF